MEILVWDTSSQCVTNCLAMSKLDDMLGKKKEVVPVLDLSKTVAHTKEEYKRLLEKVPDFKMRPIKVCYPDLLNKRNQILITTNILRSAPKISKSKTRTTHSARQRKN